MNTKTILAIDVGTGMIKAFAGRLEADGKIVILGSGAAPTAGYAKGIITDSNALTHSITQAVDCVAMAVDNKTVGCTYLGIGGSTLVAQNCVGSIAPAAPGTITGQDIDRACKAAEFTIASDNEILHVFPVRESPGRPGEALEVEVHIVSVPKSALQALTHTLAEAGISISGIVANGVMAAEIMKNELPAPKENFVLLDIGAGTTEIVGYVGDRLCFSGSLPLGGDYITSDLMQGLTVSRAHAEEIKRYYSRLSPDLRNQGVVLDCNDYGTTDKHVSFDFLYDIIESRVDEIVALVYDYLRPLLDKHLTGSGKTLECIYLTGGCGAMPSMVACAAKVFQLQTQAVKPEKLAAEYAHPANTVCYGIIHHGAKAAIREPVVSSPWNLFIYKAKKLLKI